MCEKYINLLNEFMKLSVNNPTESLSSPTFLDISGFPHWENVWSNILGFFLDSDAEHGLGDLWAKSLLECAGENSPVIEAINITREYHTIQNGRIDILLKSNEYIIGIENKVHSGVTNDLDDYKESIIHYAKEEGCKPIYVLLTLWDESKIAHDKSWCNITYENLFTQLEHNIGSYIINANTDWVIFMNHFIKTVKQNCNKIQEANTMDKNLLNFIGIHKEHIDNFLDNMYNAKKNLNKKADEITKLLKDDKTIQNNLQQKKPYYIWSYHDEHWYLSSAAVINFPRKDVNEELKIDILFVSDCKVRLFFQKTLRPNNGVEYIKEELQKQNISYKDITDGKIILEVFDYNDNDSILKFVRHTTEVVANF